MLQELGKNKALGSGVWLRKWRSVARRGHRGHLFQLGEEQAEIQNGGYSKFLDINFYCQLTKHRVTFSRELMGSSSED